MWLVQMNIKGAHDFLAASTIWIGVRSGDWLESHIRAAVNQHEINTMIWKTNHWSFAWNSMVIFHSVFLIFWRICSTCTSAGTIFAVYEKQHTGPATAPWRPVRFMALGVAQGHENIPSGNSTWQWKIHTHTHTIYKWFSYWNPSFLVDFQLPRLITGGSWMYLRWVLEMVHPQLTMGCNTNMV